MEKIEMKEKSQPRSRWVYTLPALIAIMGLCLSAWILGGAQLGKYPTLIAEAYDEQQHQLSVPGSKDVHLTRTGAYGIYYLYHPSASLAGTAPAPPALDCTLTSQSSGTKIKAVPDFVETNRYETSHGVIGVLIMSATVKEPNTYTFACHYPDGEQHPKVTVALGPNYAWEFLRVAWKLGLPLLGGLSVLCGSVLMALFAFIGIVIVRRL
jgi:hypothetical protein